MDETRMGPIVPITKIDGYDRLFAIGDIHGCRKELRVILDHLINKEGFSRKDQLIFIGDYIDRGEDSPGVIQDLIQFKEQFPKTRFLRGNHEDMLIGALYGTLRLSGSSPNRRFGGLFGHMFWYNGGGETTEQYFQKYGNGDENLRHISHNIPKEHRRFLLKCDLVIDTPDAYFVHAGFENFKRVPLEEQVLGCVTWMRYPFLHAQNKYDKPVVHGHTPVERLYWKTTKNGANQVNIDTGCVYHGQRVKNGRLSCLNVKEQYGFSVTKGETEIVYTPKDELFEKRWLPGDRDE